MAMKPPPVPPEPLEQGPGSALPREMREYRKKWPRRRGVGVAWVTPGEEVDAALAARGLEVMSTALGTEGFMALPDFKSWPERAQLRLRQELTSLADDLHAWLNTSNERWLSAAALQWHHTRKIPLRDALEEVRVARAQVQALANVLDKFDDLARPIESVWREAANRIAIAQGSNAFVEHFAPFVRMLTFVRRPAQLNANGLWSLFFAEGLRGWEQPALLWTKPGLNPPADKAEVVRFWREMKDAARKVHESQGKILGIGAVHLNDLAQFAEENEKRLKRAPKQVPIALVVPYEHRAKPLSAKDMTQVSPVMAGYYFSFVPDVYNPFLVSIARRVLDAREPLAKTMPADVANKTAKLIYFRDTIPFAEHEEYQRQYGVEPPGGDEEGTRRWRQAVLRNDAEEVWGKVRLSPHWVVEGQKAFAYLHTPPFRPTFTEVSRQSVPPPSLPEELLGSVPAPKRVEESKATSPPPPKEEMQGRPKPKEAATTPVAVEQPASTPTTPISVPPPLVAGTPPPLPPVEDIEVPVPTTPTTAIPTTPTTVTPTTTPPTTPTTPAVTATTLPATPTTLATTPTTLLTTPTTAPKRAKARPARTAPTTMPAAPPTPTAAPPTPTAAPPTPTAAPPTPTAAPAPSVILQQPVAWTPGGVSPSGEPSLWSRIVPVVIGYAVGRAIMGPRQEEPQMHSALPFLWMMLAEEE